MTSGEVVALIVALVGTGGLGAFVEALRSRRRAIAGDERDARRELAEDRRDTIVDRDGLIDQLQEDVAGLREEIRTLRQVAAQTVADLQAERAYNLTLLTHIHQGFGPPPPVRPEGA